MKITINGTRQEIEAATLADALAALDYGEATVATAVNGRFVPAPARTNTALRDGDEVEILAPMQGG